ncbi:hypothetical protein KFL_000330370 [Klebsormidium nitens]|uniref:Uncharacterized protein n=1 Tax=Klebsormidium nitens TaxID=105231 RepID=A0A1Y1HLU1_KLENI|nr:hypothetical protein KFL_000330370 [Klebsormidium nitens]|eukprot:GAQ79590.1 hypothetical protein KFL_000330370 [Klebsormidium nitens]
MESPKKKKVLEKFATTLLECTLRVDVKIGKTYKIEVTDEGFTIRKRRQKPEDGMHFRYENVDSCQADNDGKQLVLQIAPTSLGSGGGLFRFKTKEAAKIASLASRLGVVAAVRKEALARMASGHSLPSSPRSPGRVNGPSSPFTPAQNGDHSAGPPTLSPSHRSAAGGSTVPSSPDSATSRSTASTFGGFSQEPKHESSVPPAKSVAPPKWTISPTPYVGVDSALGAPPRQNATKDDVSEGDVSKEALAAALKKELARSGDPSSPAYGRQRSSGGGSQGSSKPPSAGNSKASSPKLPKHISIFRGAEGGEEQGGAWATEEGFKGSARSSDDGSAFKFSSRLSPSGTPNLSRQSSAKTGAYSRQSSLGSASVKGEGDGGIRLLPRVSSGFNPFLTDAFAELSPSASRRASSLPPPPTSPKKGVFEGFEQFVKVAGATPRASSEGSRRASSDVTSDVSRRSSDVASPPDLLNAETDGCAPPIVVEISPRGANAVAPGGLLDAEFGPGTWALGNEWSDVCPPGGAETRSALPPGTKDLGSPPIRPVLSAAVPISGHPNGGAEPLPSDLGSVGVSSAHNTVADPLSGGPPNSGFSSQPVSPVGNPFRAQYPDPFLAAFGASPGQMSVPGAATRETLGRSKSVNPFLETPIENTSSLQQLNAPIYEGLPNPFAPNHGDQTWNAQEPTNSTEINQFSSLANGSQQRVVTAPVAPQVLNPFLEPKPLSSQNGALLRSQTQPPPRKEPAWETFSTGDPISTQAVNPGLTRSSTAPPTAFSNSSTIKTGPSGIGLSQEGWEPFYTATPQPGSVYGAVGVKAAPSAAPVAPASGAKAGGNDETIPDEWENFGRQRNISSKSRPHVAQW